MGLYWLLSFVIVYYLLVFFFFLLVKPKREKRNHLRRTAPSYQADEGTLKHLNTMDGRSPPLLKTDAVDNQTSNGTTLDSSPNENETKSSQLHHCLIPACAARGTSRTTKIQCKAVLSEDSCLKRIRQRMRDITAHSGFDAVIVVLILLNTIVLALYHHGIDEEFRHILDNVNLVSCCIHEYVKIICQWQKSLKLI